MRGWHYNNYNWWESGWTECQSHNSTETYLRDIKQTNGKGFATCLKSKINEFNNKLGYSRSGRWRAKEIREKYLQEVPPKEYCRII